jgi:hypothetical protein
MRIASGVALLCIALASIGCGGGASPSADASASAAAPSAAVSSPASAEPSVAASTEPSTEPSAEASPSAAGEGQPATFWIDPTALPLDPTATSFKAILREKACASGQTPNGRIAGTDVSFTASAVTVTILVTPLPDPQDCQGNPEFPVTVTLSQAVGDRQVLDGSEDPPRDAAIKPA